MDLLEVGIVTNYSSGVECWLISFFFVLYNNNMFVYYMIFITSTLLHIIFYI